MVKLTISGFSRLRRLRIRHDGSDDVQDAWNKFAEAVLRYRVAIRCGICARSVFSGSMNSPLALQAKCPVPSTLMSSVTCEPKRMNAEIVEVAVLPNEVNVLTDPLLLNVRAFPAANECV